jgi:hypothetical protein
MYICINVNMLICINVKMLKCIFVLILCICIFMYSGPKEPKEPKESLFTLNIFDSYGLRRPKET